MAKHTLYGRYMAKRIGITMRVDTAAGHGEQRDCLALDWAIYMANVCPEANWMALPNIGEAIIEYVQQWNLDGFIFSGGNDLGSVPQRDKTETSLLDHAFRAGLPIFGVCRGLQLLHQHAGGSLVRCQSQTHVGQSHPIHLRADLLEFEAPGQVTVNSFHNWAVPARTLASSLELVAASSDGCVEAVRHRAAPIAAVQWHPERKAENLQTTLDRDLLFQTLELNH